MNRKRMGFTVIELLMALAIISLLVGILIPALSMVRKAAREVKQKAQFTGIELALGAFKNDYGDYPPSDCGTLDYCGSQKLAEALLGWDLMGFHPKSAWRADGYDGGPPPPGNLVYLSTDVNLQQRKGPYLELATANAFRLGISAPGMRDGLFNLIGSSRLSDRYVICDIFNTKKVLLATGKTVTAGNPVLYYRANTSSKNIDNKAPDFPRGIIYNVFDNDALIVAKEQEDRIKHQGRPASPPLNLLCWSDNAYQFFYEYIRDPKITARPWPYRPDSYILISAGADGFYGTQDDICNFGN